MSVYNIEESNNSHLNSNQADIAFISGQMKGDYFDNHGTNNTGEGEGIKEKTSLGVDRVKPWSLEKLIKAWVREDETLGEDLIIFHKRS